MYIDFDKDNIKGIIIVLIAAAVFIFAAFNISKVIDYHVKKSIDEKIDYKMLKNIEDTCRGMISSYNFDKVTYEQYKDSTNAEQKSWAEQAKMRANKTASTYNNYILENNYVWKGNVPEDIKFELAYIN